MKALLINDLHLASKGPATRLDDWHATVQRKLDFVQEVALSEVVDVIAVAGDLLHQTTLAYQSGRYAPMTQALRTIKRWNEEAPVVVIAGNHDLPHNRLDLVYQTPFGVLMEAGAVRPVWEPGLVYRHKDGSWVGGVSYPVTEEKVRAFANIEGPGILMLHCFANLTGGDYFGEQVFSYVELPQWVPNVKVFHFGHDHKDHGIQLIGDRVFVQVGALLRGTLADDQVNRQPVVVVVDTADVMATKHFLVPIEAPDVVFDLAQKSQELPDANQQIEAYVTHLAEATKAVGEVDVMTLVQHLAVSSEAVRAKVRHYLNQGAR